MFPQDIMLKQGSRGGQSPLPPPHNNRFSFYHIVRRRVPLSPTGNNIKDFCRTVRCRRPFILTPRLRLSSSGFRRTLEIIIIIIAIIIIVVIHYRFWPFSFFRRLRVSSCVSACTSR